MTSPDALLWISTSMTRRSPNRKVNQDAFIDYPSAGLFAVADGMGGHADGDVASRMIVDVLGTAVMPESPLDERVAQTELGVLEVNAALRRGALERGGNDIIGSTFAGLLVSQKHAVCLWAGDSRIYLFRDDRLYQLTKDHSLDHLSNGAVQTVNMITRAVGSSDSLKLDRVVTPVQIGDTFLLCSDGLTKVLTSSEIITLLSEPIEGLAERLVAAAAIRGARDDVTVIILRSIAEQDLTIPVLPG